MVALTCKTTWSANRLSNLQHRLIVCAQRRFTVANQVSTKSTPAMSVKTRWLQASSAENLALHLVRSGVLILGKNQGGNCSRWRRDSPGRSLRVATAHGWSVVIAH